MQTLWCWWWCGRGEGWHSNIYLNCIYLIFTFISINQLLNNQTQKTTSKKKMLIFTLVQYGLNLLDCQSLWQLLFSIKTG